MIAPLTIVQSPVVLGGSVTTDSHLSILLAFR
jgi:hypothetical protein